MADWLAFASWIGGTTSGLPNWGLGLAVLLMIYLLYDTMGRFTKPVAIGLLAYAIIKYIFGAPLP